MPFYRCELATNLTAESAMARIRAMIAPGPSRWNAFQRSFDRDSIPLRPFIGTAEGDRFRVRRDIRYRNSFLPIVLGRVSTVPTGVRVGITMFLHPVIAVFMLVWFSGIGYAVGLTAWRLLNTPRDAHVVFLVPAGMLIFGIVLVGTGFFSEAQQARRLLEHALAIPPKQAPASRE